jgi:hypothetical protein
MPVRTYGRSRHETESRAPYELCINLLEIHGRLRDFGASTKHSMICIVPAAGVDARADTRFAENRRTQVASLPPPEPIIKPEIHLPQVLLRRHVLIPHDELYHAELICERCISGNQRSGLWERRLDSCFDGSGAEEGYHYEGISLHRPQDLTHSPWIWLEPSVCV